MSSVEIPPRTKPAVVDKPAAPAAPWQFSLRDAFWFTTACSAALAVAVATSWGSLVASVGLIASWANVRGRLQRLQTRRVRPKLFYAAWLVLGASLFLPAVKGCNNSHIPGWRAAYVCAAGEAAIVYKVATEPQDAEVNLAGLAQVAWLTLINVANLLAVLSPLWLWRLQRGRGEWFGAALGVSAMAVWIVPWSDPHMLIGCYAWCAGFLLLTLVHRLAWRTFVLMCLVAAVSLAWKWAG